MAKVIPKEKVHEYVWKIMEDYNDDWKKYIEEESRRESALMEETMDKITKPKSEEWDKAIEHKNCINKEILREALHSAVLSMGKYRDGEIAKALDEYIGLLCEHIGLEE